MQDFRKLPKLRLKFDIAIYPINVKNLKLELRCKLLIIYDFERWGTE